MKSVSYETLRRIMVDRIASRYHDAAIKAVREQLENITNRLDSHSVCRRSYVFVSKSYAGDKRDEAHRIHQRLSNPQPRFE